MPSKKFWTRVSLDHLHTLKKINSEIKVCLLGYSFVTLPGVFSPSCSSDTEWFAEKLIPHIKKLSFLEIGTGTGIIAALAALRGASKVVATDINPQAIKNSILNKRLHHLNFSIRKGSVFDPIKHNERFDIIFWNHPFTYSEEKKFKKDMLALALFDYKYEFLKEFLKKARSHLKKNGKIFLGSGNIANIKLFKKIVKQEGFKITLLEKSIVPAYKTRKVKMDVRLYVLE